MTVPEISLYVDFIRIGHVPQARRNRYAAIIRGNKIKVNLGLCISHGVASGLSVGGSGVGDEGSSVGVGLGDSTSVSGEGVGVGLSLTSGASVVSGVG